MSPVGEVASAEGQPEDAGVLEAVQAVLDDSAAGWSAGDLDRFLGAYEPSGATTYASGGTLTRGFDAIREGYRARWARSGRVGALSLEVLDLRLMGTEHVGVVGRYRLRPPEGAPELTGLASLVLHRAAEGWRIVADHT